jgi:hypothetical protein
MLRRLSAAQELSVSVHDLQAPKEDGAILAYPPLAEAGGLLLQNRRHLQSISHDIFGNPFPVLRSSARRQVLAAAQDYMAAAGQPVAIASDQTIFLAGHQPELFHPGVWLKNFALNGLARAHGGVALNLVVDNDTAKNTLLHVPADERVAPFPFDNWQSEVPFEERAVVDEELFRNLPNVLAPILKGWSFRPLIHEFWDEACRQKERTPLLGERFAAARRVFERRWQCVNLEVPLSAVSQTDAFAWFACHLLDNLPRFREIYNAVVQAYRQRYHMRSRHHPVPDLAQEGDWLEAPLWAWRTGHKRRARLFVQRNSEGLALRAGSDAWPTLRFTAQRGELLSQWQALREAGYKIRTRALTTTMFARLFLGDVFLHGLGGAKYDELTDEIIRRFYAIEPPGFRVLTGTLLLPFPRLDVSPYDRRRWQLLQRDLWWNPQRHLNDGPPLARALSDEKTRWINQATHTAAQSRERYETLRRLTADLRPFVRFEEQQARNRFEANTHDLRAQQVRTRRDYAFCLYPEEKLTAFFRQFTS